jgi:hypothetical protein
MDLHNYADTQKIAVTTLRGWKKDALSIYRAVASHVAQLLPGDMEEKIDKYHESNNKEIKEKFQKKKDGKVPVCPLSQYFYPRTGTFTSERYFNLLFHQSFACACDACVP